MRIKTIAFLILLVTVTALRIGAHEYWIQPEKFRLAPGESTLVHLFIGDGLAKDREERKFQSEKTVNFDLVSAFTRVDLRNQIAADAMPIYSFSQKRSGIYWLGMERNWSYITLDAAKFEDYLREDGMDYIVAERKQLGESSKEGRERYSRFLKSLIIVGGKHDVVFGGILGQKLEIVPLTDPYKKKVGDDLHLKILFNGKPLAGTVVFADNCEAETQRMTSDKNGRVSVKIAKQGMWLVRLVKMERCKENCENADWQSFWSAFTFGVAE